MSHKFRVGDRVKIIKRGRSADSIMFFGKVVTITNVGDDYVSFRDVLGGLWFDEIELEEIAESPLFKIMTELEENS